ncbi:MAG: hypothetical protein R2941_16145 [Desulfobacterales bacterium]
MPKKTTFNYYSKKSAYLKLSFFCQLLFLKKQMALLPNELPAVLKHKGQANEYAAYLPKTALKERKNEI